jgi:hypothetical protein
LLKEIEGRQNQTGAEHGNGLQEEVHEGHPNRQGYWLKLVIPLTMRAVINPRLAIDLLRLVWAFRSRDWYRRPPFLPVPPPDYVRWRMYTAYGDATTVPPLSDVIRFARWRREVMRL